MAKCRGGRVREALSRKLNNENLATLYTLFIFSLLVLLRNKCRWNHYHPIIWIDLKCSLVMSRMKSRNVDTEHLCSQAFPIMRKVMSDNYVKHECTSDKGCQLKLLEIWAKQTFIDYVLVILWAESKVNIVKNTKLSIIKNNLLPAPAVQLRMI